MALRAESAILGNGRADLGAFEQHPPGIFVSCIKDPVQSSVLRRVKLPQIKAPLLTREDPADEHNLDYIDKLDRLAHQGLDACLQSGHLFFVTQ